MTIKTNFDSNNDHLIEALAYITTDLKKVVKIGKIGKATSDAKAKRIQAH